MSVTAGVRSGPDLEKLAARVSAVVGVEPELRDSLYYGGDYYLLRMDDLEVRAFPNRDPVDGTPYVGDAGTHPLVVRLDGDEDAAQRVIAALREAEGIILDVL